MNNIVIAAGWGGHDYSDQTANVISDQDYYEQASGIQTTSTSPFNGSSGTGWGTIANIPPHCTTGLESGGGTAYFATDVGNWNSSVSNAHGVQMNGADGLLYKCTATDTWTLYYRPYDYPHPLINGGSCTPSKVVFTAQPGNALIGAALGTVRVEVQDSGSTTCTSDTSTITIANKGGTCTGMTLGGTASGSAVAGVLTTTNLTESAAGSCTLTATDGALTSADSSAFTITAPPSPPGQGVGKLKKLLRP